jgi:hypothetical protein
MPHPLSVTYRTPSERQRIIESRPLARVRRFASLLNWHGLQLETCTIESEERDETSRRLPLVVTYYMTTQLGFHLQVNQREANSPLDLWATVVGWRLSMPAMPFLPFELFEDDRALAGEAERLRPQLDRRLWKSRNWRKDFLRKNPVPKQFFGPYLELHP